MVVFFALLAATAVAAIAGAVTLTVTDGYGRVPTRTHARVGCPSEGALDP